MKVKYLAAACAAACATLGSAGALAGVPLPTNTGVPTGLVTYYIAGASAQAQAVDAVIPTAAFFQTGVNDVVKISGGSANSAYYGLGQNAITGGVNKPLLIVYRNSNGSGSGVRQLLAKRTAPADGKDADALARIALIPLVGTDNTNLPNLTTCTAAVAGGPTGWTATCTSLEARSPDVALSDVEAKLLAGSFPVPNVDNVAPGPVGAADYWARGALVASRNALQGFGVAVNPAAYAALQTQNIAEGKLAAACAGSTTIDCQPSIRSDDYASLISADGGIKDSDGLFNSAISAVAAKEVTVCRRTDLSGTQASSNTFFLNNLCGTAGFGGVYTPFGVADSNPGTLVFNEGSSTGNAKTCLNKNASTDGYRLGVISLENIPVAGTDNYKFVKVDDQSPNYTYNGAAVVADPKQRQQFANGSYKFAFEMYAMRASNAPANIVAFYNALNSQLGDSTKSDLVGIGYFDIPGAWVGNDTTNLATRVTRNSNNCGPLLP